MNKTSWYSSVTKLLKIFNIQDTMHLNKSKFGQSLRQSLVKKYLLDWQHSNDMLKDGKLVRYLFLKTNFGLEKYLTLINNFNYRKSICTFRVSAHRLYIETGRYKNIPRNERLCKYFSANEIEDEAHFLIKCDQLNNKREELFKLISSKVKNFTKLSNNQKLYYILTCKDQEILQSVGMFLSENMP
jgi:hypothetical protein